MFVLILRPSDEGTDATHKKVAFFLKIFYNIIRNEKGDLSMKYKVIKSTNHINAGIIGECDFSNTYKTGNCMFYPDNGDPYYRICVSADNVERID